MARIPPSRKSLMFWGVQEGTKGGLGSPIYRIGWPFGVLEHHNGIFSIEVPRPQQSYLIKALNSRLGSIHDFRMVPRVWSVCLSLQIGGAIACI